jgi:hypothetical protein
LFGIGVGAGASFGWGYGVLAPCGIVVGLMAWSRAKG